MPATSGAPERSTGASSAPPGLTPGAWWRRVFPGEERQLAEVRRWLTGLLPPCPARDDVTIVASELAGNAVKHTASGRGEWLAVELTYYGPVVRVGVFDRGGLSEPEVVDDPFSEHGRGLLVVRGLSVRTGVSGGHAGRLVWADINWSQADAATMALLDAFEAALCDLRAALPHRPTTGTPPWWTGQPHTWGQPLRARYYSMKEEEEAITVLRIPGPALTRTASAEDRPQ
jgi:histidine kinase-like protein